MTDKDNPFQEGEIELTPYEEAEIEHKILEFERVFYITQPGTLSEEQSRQVNAYAARLRLVLLAARNLEAAHELWVERIGDEKEEERRFQQYVDKWVEFRHALQAANSIEL